MDSVLEDVLVELLVDRPFRSVKEMNRHLLPRRNAYASVAAVRARVR